MEKKLTIEKIKNADWEIHNNATDYNWKQSIDDGQEVYKSYNAVIDDHEVTVEYSEHFGYVLYIDGEKTNVEEVFGEDVEMSEVVETINEMLDDTLDDLDEIELVVKWEMSDEVESYENEDLEVRSYIDQDGELVYIAYDGEDYIDNYDFDQYKKYLRSDVEEWLDEQADEKLNEYANDNDCECEYDEEKKNEVLNSLVIDIMDYFDSECDETYLEYYYNTSEDYHSKMDFLGGLCYDFLDQSDIEGCIVVTKQNDDED